METFSLFVWTWCVCRLFCIYFEIFSIYLDKSTFFFFFAGLNSLFLNAWKIKTFKGYQAHFQRINQKKEDPESTSSNQNSLYNLLTKIATLNLVCFSTCTKRKWSMLKQVFIDCLQRNWYLKTRTKSVIIGSTLTEEI